MSCKVSESFRVGDLPTVYCVPEYVSATEEASLLREINGSRARWTQVSKTCRHAACAANGKAQTEEEMLLLSNVMNRSELCHEQRAYRCVAAGREQDCM